MGDRHDYVALEWVKGEIAETLKQARQALEAFVENPQDPTRMRFCLTYAHQVHGTLQMVEFYGAALLAEEMERLAQALVDGRIGNQSEALEVLMQAILQLPAYLDRVQSARRDLPMVVLPLLNDLRAARGEKLLSETSLFAPDLSSAQPRLSSEALAHLNGADLPGQLRKLRQMLQLAQVGLIRGQDTATNLGYMARVFARLEQLCAGAPLAALWQIASGLVEGLANGDVASGTSVRNLLRQIDKELKRLLEQGADGINQPAPDELTKNLLFYIAKAPGNTPRIAALKERYRLDEALPDRELVDEERARLAGPDRGAMRSVVSALCEELVRIKDNLDLFVRGDRSNTGELENLQAPLKQIADTLAVLGFGQPRKVILDQLAAVRELTQGQHEPSDALLMDIAGALLYVEATLAGMVGPHEDGGSEEHHLPTTDVVQIQQIVIKEARNGLEQAKDAIIEFIASQWNHEHLERVPELLTQIRGGLAMIPLERAAALLDACKRYIQEQILVCKAVPSWQSLDTLADAITSVEYYLERLAEDRASQGDMILDVAEKSLASLGYPLRAQAGDNAAPALAPQEQEPDTVAAGASLPPQAEETAEPLAWEPEAPATSETQPETVLEALDDTGLDEAPAAPSDTPESLDWGLDEELPRLEQSSPEPAELEWSLDEEPNLDSSASEIDDWLQDFETLTPEKPDEQSEITLDAPLEILDSAASAWEEFDLSDLDLPEVELPSAPAVSIEQEQPPRTVAEVLATPLQAINPPAQSAPPSLLPPPADEEPVDEELLEVFIEEVGEVLDTLGEYLPRWHAARDDRQALGEVRRAFHTLKGSGRMVRALVIGELAWAVENLLNRVLDNSIEGSDEVLGLVAEVVALMPALRDEFAAKAQRQRDDVDHLAACAYALATRQPRPQPAQFAEPAATDADDSEELDPQLIEIFRNEAENHLETLAAFLADCATQLPQPVTDDLQRALHTLKGSASMAGILPVAEIATPLERLVKEYKTNLLDIDLAEAELLRRAETLFQRALEHLDERPLSSPPGAAGLLADIQALHQERLEHAESQRQAGQNGARDPQLISIFLAEGMDILLDAEKLLQRWRQHPAERQELGSLLEELTTLGRGAQMADLPQIDELCEALLDLYGAIEEGSLPVSERFFSEAELAHEALVGMMDQVAAALQVTPQPERVAALRELLEQALAPDTLALLEHDADGFMQVRELERASDTPEPSEATVEEHTEEALESPIEDNLDGEMVAIFLEEAVDILDSAGQALERWVNDPDNQPALSSLQRDLHTLKGGARMAEIGPIGDLAHELESAYEGLLDQRYGNSTELATLLLRSHDRLAQMLENLQAGQSLNEPLELLLALRDFRQHATPSEVPAPAPGVREQATPAARPAPTPPAASATAADDDEHDQELVEIFLEEGFDIIDSAGAALQRWIDHSDNLLELEELQRHLHTLKGGARMAEVSPIGDLAHELEYLYEDLGNGRQQAGGELFKLLLACHDRLAAMLDALRADQPLPDGQQLIATLRQLRQDPASPPAAATAQPDSAPGPTDTAMAEAEADILEIFLEEAEDLLESIEAAIGQLEQQRDATQPLDDILRTLHTLKGGARLSGQRQLGDLTHDFEQHLGEARQQGAPWPESLFADLQSGYEGLQASLDELRQRLQASPPEPAPDSVETAPAASLPTQPASAQARVPDGAPRELPFVRRAQQAAQENAARRGPQELVKVPAELLENLVNLAGETSIFRGRVEQQVSDFGFTLNDMEATIDRVRDQLRRLDTETQAQILSRYQAEAERAGYEDFDPLEMDRHSQLQQLSRALFESASDLLDLKETLAARNRDAETLLLQQARVNTELQEGLMRTRMVPFDRLLPRLRRIVRQIAGELGKQVEFQVGNAEGEMDRSVLERIVAPLEHMLRNAVDHGIEPAEVRRAQGKPEHGNIRLELGREGGDIVLSLSDDGAGIDTAAVRRKAIERGLMDTDTPLGDHEVLQFILEAGFSTASQVTQISGRGVGMDVAVSEVKQLGGSISIDSQPGQGTRFTVRLPFTVSVNRALMVLSGEDLYAIPLNTIEGIVRVSPYELEAYYQPGAPRFEYAGQSYELRYLGDLLNNGQQPKLVGQSLPLPVILVRSSEHAVAVQVDALGGSREIVVKSLGLQFASVPGISGATILGDGRVVVILDLLATIRALHARQLGLALPRRGLLEQSQESDSERPPLVMVVDDSVTVRKVTSRLLERNGMNVLTAKDGVDAIAQLQEQRPDIMLLDIEMPRMDGFEVATLVRHDERLKDLPIIMITSRTGEKHRERAMNIGVNQYLGKPYQESQLLDSIAHLIGQEPRP